MVYTSFEQMFRIAQAAVKQREANICLEQLKEQETDLPAALPFASVVGALRPPDGNVAIMAEIKRASPATGLIDPILDPAALARQYVCGGAAAISIITEPWGYLGSLADFRAVRQEVEQVPLLRKELVVSPYQIHESRVLGVDLVLMVAALLTDAALESLIERTHSLGMVAVVECHSRLEARSAIRAGAQVIGINARDLETGQVDRSKLEQILDVIPANITVMAESGVRTPRDVFEYARVGADAVLVGEALVRSNDPAVFLQEMVAAGSHPSLRPDRRSRYRAQSA